MSFICDKSTATTNKSNIHFNNSLIPQEAYLFFPEEIKGKKRNVFDGDINLSENEEKLLSQIENDVSLLQVTKGEILRFLYENNNNIQTTISLINKFCTIKAKYLRYPIDSPPGKIIKFLNSGMIYVVGRDNRFRPIIMVNIEKVIDAQRKLSKETVIEALIFFFTFIVEHLMLPGQIEKWNVIINSKNLMCEYNNDFKYIFHTITNCFPCRLHYLYIVNCNDVSSFMWNFLKIAIENKIKNKNRVFIYKTIDKGKYHYFNFINPEQIEMDIGGIMKNKEKHFFPPNFENNQNFFVKNDIPSKILVSNEEYTEKLQNETSRKKYKINYNLLTKSFQLNNKNQNPTINNNSQRNSIIVLQHMEIDTNCKSSEKNINSTSSRKKSDEINKSSPRLVFIEEDKNIKSTNEINKIINEQINEVINDPIKDILPPESILPDIIIDNKKTKNQCISLCRDGASSDETCQIF